MVRKGGFVARICCEVGESGVICIEQAHLRNFETQHTRTLHSERTQLEKESRLAKTTTEVEPTVDARSVVDLNGEFHFKVDSKGRVALPAKFRKVLAKDLVITPDPLSECIYVFQTSDFNAWVDRLFIDKFGAYDEANKTHVALRRKLKANARDVEVDGQGRIMLNSDIREKADIEREVVVLGNTGRFEIWDAKRYDKLDEEVDLSLFYA